MQPRRLVPVAVLALLGGLALAGCRSQPTVAAYVDQTQITESQVDAMVKDGADTARKYSNQPGLHAPSRAEVVATLVLSQVCDQAKAKKGFTTQQVSTEQVQQLQHVSAKSKYAKARAHLLGCLLGAAPTGTQVQPTDAELHDLYARLQAAGATNGASYDKFVADVKDLPQLQQALASARAFKKLVQGSDITVNPRYRPLEFPLLSTNTGATAIALPLGEPGLGAVTNAH